MKVEYGEELQCLGGGLRLLSAPGFVIKCQCYYFLVQFGPFLKENIPYRTVTLSKLPLQLRLHPKHPSLRMLLPAVFDGPFEDNKAWRS